MANGIIIPEERVTNRRDEGITSQRAPLTWREVGFAVAGALSLGITWALWTTQMDTMRDALEAVQRSDERVAMALDAHVKAPGHQISLEKWEQSAQDRQTLHDELKEVRSLLLMLQQSQISLRDTLLDTREPRRAR